MIRIKPRSKITAQIRRHVLNVLAVLLTLELCSRAFVPEQFDLVMRDPVVGRSLVKNVNEEIFNNESHRIIHVKTNSLGFRGEDPQCPKPTGVRRVVVLGDSFISALQVQAGETMCRQLETLLNQASRGYRWEVLNFGVTGSGTADQHIRYLGTIRKLEPDVILVGFGMATDPVDNSPHLSSSPLVHYDFDANGELKLIPSSAVAAETSNYLNEFSQLYIWQKGVTNRVIKRVRKRAGWFDKRDRIYLDPVPEEIENSWRLTAAILKQFQIDVINDGAEFHVVTIPSGREIYRDVLNQLEQKGREAGLTESFNQDLPLEKIAEICQQAGISLIALEPGFREFASDRNSRIEAQQLFYNRDGHMNLKGNRIAAEVIATQLLKENRSPSVPLQVVEETEKPQLR